MSKHILLYLKGAAMGLADLVPGISGGTVALLTGIYERLISGLARLDWNFLIALVSLDTQRLRHRYQAGFFIILAGGLCSGIAIGAPIINHLLEFYRPLTFSFFGGLIAASLLIMISKNLHIPFFILGVAGGLLLLAGGGVNMSFNHINIFFAGAIAICAMLLPGISGSFVLLLLDIYHPLVASLVSLDLSRIFVFAAGALVGMILFSKLVHFLLARYRHQILSLLLGVVTGSLALLWPWQQESRSLLSPFAYTQLTSQNNYLYASCLLFIIGCSLVFLLRWLGSNKSV